MSVFELYRSDGRLAISSNHPQYVFIKKIRGGGKNLPHLGNFWDQSGRKYTESVIVAFLPVNQGDYGSFRFARGARVLRQPSPPAPRDATLSMHSECEVDAFVFDIAQPDYAKTDVGLVVYNRDGVITFNSNNIPLRMAMVCSGSAPTSHNPWIEDGKPVEFTTKSNRIALVPLKDGGHVVAWGGTGEQAFGLTWYSISGNKAIVRMVYEIEDFSGSKDDQFEHTIFNFLIVDVRGIDG